MSLNPLKHYFRQPATYLKLPSAGMWYNSTDVSLTADNEVGVLSMSALDEIMINTPDAILNGITLENILQHCVEGIANPKSVVIPDLEAMFVSIKLATTGPMHDHSLKCTACEHENLFEVNLENLINTITYIDITDTVLELNGQLRVHVKPYTLAMRQIYIKRELEEQQTSNALESIDSNTDQFARAQLISQSIDRMSRMTFELVSNSVTKVVILETNEEVTDQSFIAEWLSSIGKIQADMIIEQVGKLNMIGINKTLQVMCEECNHQWESTLDLDPTSFFGKR